MGDHRLPTPLRPPERPWIPAVAVSLLLGPLFASGPFAAAVSASQEGGLEPIRTGGISVETAALIMSGQEGGQIPLEGLAVPLPSTERPSTDGRTQVLVVIEASGDALLAGHAGGPLAFEVIVYALDEEGVLSGTLLQSFELQLDILGERLRETGVKFVGDLGLRPGRYTLRAMVRRPSTNDLGIRFIPVAVPDGPPEPLSPLVVEAEGSWIVARESGPGASPTPLPVPAARPVLALGEEAKMQLAPPPSIDTASRLRIALGDAAGTEHELEGHLGSAAGPASGFGLMEATFVPADVPVGSYGLRAVMEARSGSTETGSALPVVLVRRPAEGAGPYAGVWPALGKVTSRFDRAEPRDTVDAGERALQARLGEMLRALAAGDDTTAQDLVWELTSSAVDGPSAELLERVEARAFRSIADARPEGLGPVMMLYFWLYSQGLESQVPAIFSHARMTLLKVTNLFLKASGGDSEAARQAAQMLTGLGGVVRDAGLIGFSEELFLRAIALDSANEATLLALAVNDEKVGNHSAAAAHLKDLLKLDPGHGQARLRMAVNLARSGKEKGAAEHLERLMKGSSDGADWVVSLAYQELAKLHLAAGRPEEATEVLDAGIERRPQDEKLHVILAFVNDALARPGEAMRVLSRLRLPRPAAEGSPRHRYTLWPTEALDETRRSVRAKAEAQRVDLAKALGLETVGESAP